MARLLERARFSVFIQKGSTMSRIMIGLLVVLLVAVTVPFAAASQLVFQPDTGSFGDFGQLPPGYGDRIAAVTQDGFLYSLDGGATPNVVTQFGPTDGLPILYTWSSEFGDLQNMI